VVIGSVTDDIPGWTVYGTSFGAAIGAVIGFFLIQMKRKEKKQDL
jgi:hypothetical protein